VNWLNADDIILAALAEDVGAGDITTELLPNAEREASGVFRAKAAGVLCGSDIAERCFALFGEAVAKFTRQDGDDLSPGEDFGFVTGPGRDILTVERVALNFLQRLSGIASQTRRMATLASDAGIRVVETRKTTPGLRMLEKYAVRVGGGFNHRMGLDDCVMLKDNHFALAGGDPGNVVRAVKAGVSHSMKVIAEATTPEMAHALAAAGADVVLLDNFAPATVRSTVELLNGRCSIELSGGITEDNIADYLVPGVDVISIGALTHSYKSLDISLDFTVE
jgi:nicotinate-nucleotide pyrophosphorylase (carboxylating)